MTSNAQIATKVTLIGSVADLLLGLGKIIVGVLYHSHALIVDGIHSLSDLVTDFFVIIISRVSHIEPDEDHPYGHEKFETLGTLIVGGVLLLTAGALIYENLEKIIIGGKIYTPGKLTLYMAAASVIIKEAIFWYTKKAGEKINSQLLIANAWHSRSDALSSVVVFVGLLFSIYGYSQVDQYAALLVALLIGKMGFDFMKNSFIKLADTALDPEKLNQVRKTIMDLDGVNGIHNLRSRFVGESVFVDVNVEVCEKLTVSEGHEIASWVAKMLIENFSEVVDVTVHTDVENDLVASYNSNRLDLLPLRHEVVTNLKEHLTDSGPLERCKDLRLHYKKKNIDLELIFEKGQTPTGLKETWKKELSGLSWINDINILEVQ